MTHPALSIPTRAARATFLALALGACTVRAGSVREPEPKPAPKPAVEPAPTAAAPAPAAATPTESEEKKKKHGHAKKKDAAPAALVAPPAEAPAPAPDPALRTIALPLRVPLSLARAEIEKRVPARYARGWEPVTKPDANPSVDVRVTVWRDAIGLRVEGDVVHVELPLRYAADIRGKAKTPFGKSVSLADGQTWGTEAEPQRLTLRGRARVDVSAEWELGVKLELDAPEHGRAPSGSICTAGSFQLCVSKETIAPVVREKIDNEIRSRFAKLDETLQELVRDEAKLPKRMKKLWGMLGCPIPLDPGVKFDCGKGKAPKQETRWLVLDPVAADVAYRGDGDALVVEARLTARIEESVGAPPARRELGPLPARGAPPAAATSIEITPGFDVEELRRAVRERIAPTR